MVTIKVQIPEIRKTLEKALTTRGVLAEEARIVADEYLSGELQGKLSHGLMAFPSLAEKLTGKEKKFEILKKTHSTLVIDGNEDFGAYVGQKAADTLMEMAEKEGIGFAIIKNITTWLRPGTLARYIADKGYVGIVMNNGGKPMIAAPGGYDPVIGTNPIGIGIPTAEAPIVTDMATSVRAWGEVRKAAASGTDLPKDTYLDKKGDFAVKAEDAYSVLPAGGYKGFALGVLIEVLTGSFMNRAMGAVQMAGDYRMNTRGAVIIVLNPNLTSDAVTFRKANTQLVKEIKNSSKLEGVKEIKLPGEKAEKNKAANEKRCLLEIDEKLWKQLQSFAL